MIGIIHNHQAVKIAQRKLKRQHRNHHIDNAKRIREAAEMAPENTNAMMHEIYGDDLPYEVVREVEANYTSMLAEAIAEENRKCMDGEH